MTTSKFFGGVRGFAIAGISGRATASLWLFLFLVITGSSWAQVGREETDGVSVSREAVFVRGDANADGRINMADGMSVLGYIFLGSEAPECLDAADADDNGELAITDSLRLFGYLFNGASAPAAPSPSSVIYGSGDCEEDPTRDLLGCEEASSVCEFEEYPGVSVSSEMLVFDDQEVFQNTMRRIRLEDASDEEELAVERSQDRGNALDYFEETVGFVSMRSQRIQQAEDGLREIDDSLIASDYLLTFLNPRGEIRIGDRIYVVSSRQVLEIDAGDMQALRESREGNNSENVIAHRSAGGDCAWLKSCSSGWVEYGDGNRRFKGRIWIFNMPFYAEAGGKTKHEQRSSSSANWRCRKADGIGVGGEFVATDGDCLNGSSVDFGKSKSNRKRVEWSITWLSQVTKLESFVSGHGVEDDGYSYSFTLDLFNCIEPTPPAPPAPSSPPLPQGAQALVMSHDSGLFVVSSSGELERSYWDSNTWHRQTIPHWGASLVPGSLIRGEFGEKIYGVNTDGQIFTTWRDNGVITFTLINPPGGVSVRPDSLVMSHDSGLFSVGTNGALERFYWDSNTWHRQTISHWGAPLVPRSLIRGEFGEKIYGVNTDGQIFSTWRDNGVITFTLIP
ncbi:MAG: hypothetical protein VB855_14215 [Pirellulaceae bacterium]